MLEPLIENINTAIGTLDIFQTIHGLSKLVKEELEEGDKIYPVEYMNNGESRDIDWDTGKSVSYIRRLAPVPVEYDDEYLVGCERGIIRSFPLRIVGVLFDCNDTQYRDERQIENIINTVAFDANETLAGNMNAEHVELRFIDYDSDRNRVIEEEFDGIDIDVPFEAVLFRIDFEAIVVTDVECFTNFTCP